MIYLDYPSKVLCVLMEDGSLVMGHIILNDSYLSYSWSSHSFGGKDTKVISITSSYDDNNQYLWLVTERKINSEYKRFIELLKFDSLKSMYLNNQQTPVYLDLYLNQNMLNNQICNLDIFEGETLSVINKQGVFLGSFEVKSGTINIQGNTYENGEVIVGYCFDSIYKTPVLENLNETMGEVKINKISFIFYKSSHINVLNKKGDILQKNILNNRENLEYYQNINLNINSFWDTNQSIALQQNLPFCMNIVSINLLLLNK